MVCLLYYPPLWDVFKSETLKDLFIQKPFVCKRGVCPILNHHHTTATSPFNVIFDMKMYFQFQQKSSLYLAGLMMWYDAESDWKLCKTISFRHIWQLAFHCWCSRWKAKWKLSDIRWLCGLTFSAKNEDSSSSRLIVMEKAWLIQKKKILFLN